MPPVEVTGSELDLREGTGYKERKGFDNPVSLLVQQFLFKLFITILNFAIKFLLLWLFCKVQESKFQVGMDPAPLYSNKFLTKHTVYKLCLECYREMLSTDECKHRIKGKRFSHGFHMLTFAETFIGF